MKRQFLLPDPGEGLLEAEIVSWRVEAGQEVEVNDVLVEIETAKSLVELPSPFAGTVSSLLVPEGATVEVGTAIVEIDDGAEGEEPNLVGYGPRDEPVASRRRRRAAAEPEPAPEVSAEPPGPRAKPPVRKYARDLGVDLSGVAGSGPDGVITRADVEAASTAGRPSPMVGDEPRQAAAQEDCGGEATGAQPAGDPGTGGVRGPGGAGDHRIPIKGVRKATAEAMVRSVTAHVHVTEWLTCDVTGTMELVETLKGRREFAGQRVSPLLVYAKAVCLALGRNPGLNASWDGQAGEIIHHGDVNLGIATATPRGLMVPNIKAAQGLSLLELCQAIGRLVAVSREGRLQPPDYAGGTFTITNVGVFGVDAGTPIINDDESAILCMGAIQRRPWVVGTGAEERVVPRWVTTLALSFDHRIIDGEEASRFLRDVAEILADPALALLF